MDKKLFLGDYSFMLYNYITFFKASNCIIQIFFNKLKTLQISKNQMNRLLISLRRMRSNLQEMEF